MTRSEKRRKVVALVVQKLLQRVVVLETPTCTIHVLQRNKKSTTSWLVDSGCTNHMTCDDKFLKDLDRSLKSIVGMGNEEYLKVKGKSTVAIESCAGTKLISNVLFVPKIDQNLSSVGQLVEKGFEEMFE
ncbi:gag-pol polyprotein [Gossypium australe]|uniref:Gag-pol polyprotein n=1 Tax=Gossypium australe TaxID=47621 RepID=A0A5B6X218_9ROSI|nr:gag-pol polyprotein [Gossypium australe]